MQHRYTHTRTHTHTKDAPRAVQPGRMMWVGLLWSGASMRQIIQSTHTRSHTHTPMWTPSRDGHSGFRSTQRWRICCSVCCSSSSSAHQVCSDEGRRGASIQPAHVRISVCVSELLGLVKQQLITTFIWNHSFLPLNLDYLFYRCGELMCNLP